MEEESIKYSVDEAITAMGFGNFQGLLLAYTGMGSVAEAAELMLLSFIGPAVQSEWDLSPQEDSLISSAVFVGMLVGAYFWGVVSDKYGRRMAILIPTIFTSGAGLLSAFSPNYISLIILRGLVGIGLGGGYVFLSWFLEFIPTQNRGKWVVVFSTFWTVGTFFGASLAWIVMPTLGWRWLLALCALPALLLLLFYAVAPESPRYLCTKGRVADAVHVLDQIARMNNAKLPPGMLVGSHMIEPDENYSVVEDTSDLLRSLSNNAEIETGVCTLLSMLFGPKLVKSTLLLWVAFFGNMFAYYGITLLSSALSSQNGCKSKSLHSKNSVDDSLYRDVFITTLAELPGLLLSAAIVDRIGRKHSMAVMLFLCCIILLPLLLPQPEVVTVGLLFGARMCVASSSSIVNIYAPEVYPTSVRTTGFGVATAVGKIGGMICPLVAVGLIDGRHQTLSIALFECVIFLTGLAVLFFPLETKGLALTDTLLALE